MYVYFICESVEGPIKIGRAKDPFRRVKELQTGNHRTLHLIGYCYLEDAWSGLNVDDKRAELLFHNHYSDKRINGSEWFGVSALDLHRSLSDVSEDCYLYTRWLFGTSELGMDLDELLGEIDECPEPDDDFEASDDTWEYA